MLTNVYFESAGAAPDGTVACVAGPPVRAFGCGAAGCGYVVQLLASGGDAFPPIVHAGLSYIIADPVYARGAIVPSATVLNASSFAPGVPLPLPGGAAALLSRHSYSARAFPSFEWLRAGGGGSALCAWDLGLAGDGSDEGAALQAAVDAAAAAGAALVLLRGAYVTSVSIVLPPGVALVGVARTQTALVAALGGVRRGTQSDAAFAPAVLYAAPSPAAAPRAAGATGEPPLGTVVAFLAVYSFATNDNVTGVMLSSPGEDSAGGAVRNVWRQALASRLGGDQATFANVGGAPPPPRPTVTSERPAVVLGGSAGTTASWHMQVFFNDEDGTPSRWSPVSSQGARYRHLLVVNASRLRFYHLNVEHAYSDADSEFAGLSDVDVFSLKKENAAVACWVRGCSRLRVLGHGGNGAALPYDTTERRTFGPDYADSLPSLYRIEACADCLFANLFHQNGGDAQATDAWHMLTERADAGPPDNSSWTATDFLERPTLYMT